MPTIAIVDDRADERETLQLTVERHLRNRPGWRVIVADPLGSLAEYPQWLRDHDVNILLMDERLHEGGGPSEPGSSIAAALRERHVDLPIYIITAHKDDSGIEDKLGNVEGVVDRTDFANRPDPYIDRFIRAGERYVEEFEKELADISSLASKVAADEATADDVNRLRALQQKLLLAVTDEDTTRAEWLRRLEAKLDVIERHLGGKDK